MPYVVSAIRDTLRAQGFQIGHQSVTNILDRTAEAPAAAGGAA